MFLSPKKKTVVGLDIGTSSVKGIQLELKDNEIVFLGYNSLSLSEQGILNDSEYCHTISVWLEENHWKEIGICASLPQYLTTVNVRDFPASANSAHLMDTMINYETQHLSGISEETFINDYHVMAAAFGRVNPVLIGICKESVIDEKVKILDDIGLNLVDLSIDSIAVANAIFSLNPNLRKDSNPQLVLEIGNDSSTGIIVARGQILYITSLMGGADSISKELQQANEAGEQVKEPGKELLQVLKSSDSPQAQRPPDTVKNELLNLIDHWHDLENEELKNAAVSRIWLSGGGARVEGLNEYLYDVFKCPIEIFGPIDPGNGKVLPELTVAYGLAVIGLNKEDISISLCPENIQWVNRRKKNFNFLAAASVFFISAIFFYLLGEYINLSVSDHRNRAEMNRLSKCNTLIPQLENTLETINHHQKMMIPFVIKGNSSNRFISAFKEIAKITAPDHFFIYVADDATFQEGNAILTGNKNHPQSGLSSAFFNSETGKAKKVLEEDQTKFIVVDDMQELDAIVLIGFTLCATNNEHYAHLRKIEEELNQSSLFNKIDILPDEKLDGRKDIFGNWERDVVNNRFLRPHLKRMRFRSFGIRMPFSEKNVKLEPPKDKK